MSRGVREPTLKPNMHNLFFYKRSCRYVRSLAQASSSMFFSFGALPPCLLPQFIPLAPREGILTELLIPTGGEVGVSAPAASSSTTQSDPQSQGATRPPQPAGDGSAQDAWVKSPSEAPSKDQSQSSSQLSEESTQELSQESSDTPRSSPLPQEPDPQDATAAAATVNPTPLTNQNTEPKTLVTKIIKPAVVVVIVGRLSFCGHPELHGTLCTSCGRNVAPLAAGASNSKSAERGHRASGGFNAGSRERNSEHGGAMSKVTMKGGGTLTLSSTGERERERGRNKQRGLQSAMAFVLPLAGDVLVGRFRGR